MQLKLLEEELQVQLVIRGARKIQLTDIGEVLYKRTKHIMTIYNSIIKEVEDYKNGVKGYLKLGVGSSSGYYKRL